MKIVFVGAGVKDCSDGSDEAQCGDGRRVPSPDDTTEAAVPEVVGCGPLKFQVIIVI